MTQIQTKRRSGLRGKTTIDVIKEFRSTRFKVVNKESNGKLRQITFALDVKTRQELLEALLSHHEEDVG